MYYHVVEGQFVDFDSQFCRQVEEGDPRGVESCRLWRSGGQRQQPVCDSHRVGIEELKRWGKSKCLCMGPSLIIQDAGVVQKRRREDTTDTDGLARLAHVSPPPRRLGVSLNAEMKDLSLSRARSAGKYPTCCALLSHAERSRT